MEEQKYQPEEQYDEIDIMELLRKLLKDRKFILRWCAVAAVAGLVIGFSIPKEFTVTSKLAPEIVDRRSSSLSSFASMAGINLGGMSTSDAVSPDLYPEIVSSAPFVIDLFSVPVQFMHKKDTVRTDVYGYYKEYTRAPWWGYVLQAPMKAIGWGMSLVRGKPEKIEGYESVNPVALTTEQAAIAKAIKNSISVVVDKKTMVITVTVAAQNPRVALKLSEVLIDRLQSYVTDYRTGKSRKDVVYYEKIYSEAKADYFDAQQRYARYVDSNQMLVRQSVKTEQERLKNEMDLSYQIYNSAAQQLQVAKAKVQLETPVFTVLNPPTLPLRASKPSKLKTLVAFIFLGAVCSGVWVLWGRDWTARFKKEESEEETSGE